MGLILLRLLAIALVLCAVAVVWLCKVPADLAALALGRVDRALAAALDDLFKGLV